ncbi:hypothetical protein ACFYWX_15900 [Streptomyces sp. NPDC002888]|uniref:hypothetical protein n=1 Tax=Streptomyces sp. NPDC002888 TaxID=3364668 RepID=UPI0036AA2C1B
MSGEEKHGVGGSMRRLFGIPPGTPRSASPPVPMLRVWLFGLAVGAGATALGWEEAPTVILLVAIWSMLDDVTNGVRHRWPAFVGSLALLYALLWLAPDIAPGPNEAWNSYALFAVVTLVALTTFVAVTRLPPRGER